MVSARQSGCRDDAGAELCSLSGQFRTPGPEVVLPWTVVSPLQLVLHVEMFGTLTVFLGHACELALTTRHTFLC